METIRTDTEEAARNLGANYFAVVRHIILPLSMPGVLVAVILIFIKTFGDYAITKSAGPIYPTSLSVNMHTTATMFREWNRAACIGVIIIATALVFVVVYSKLARVLQRPR